VKTLFYCHHSVGIGHLVRTLRLAEASLTNGPVMLLSGGAIPTGLTINSRIHVVPLPPLRVDADYQLIAANGDGDVEEIFEQRRQIAVRAVRVFLPDVVVIEMFPFGRKKFAREVLGIINSAREQKKIKVISSVRDVLVTTRRDQDRFDLRATKSLNENFDAVLVHSDQNLVRLEATFSTLDKVEIPIYYTGYISSASRSPAPARQRRIVVSAGGGRVGHELIDAALESCASIKRDLDLDMLIVTGPNAGHRARLSNGKNGPEIVEFINNLPGIFARSMISVSQCGYNTAVDVLKTQTPAIFVPYETAGEDEQLRRAQLLAKKGRAVLLRQESLTADAITRAASKLLARRQDTFNIDLDGAQRSSDLIREVRSRA